MILNIARYNKMCDDIRNKCTIQKTISEFNERRPISSTSFYKYIKKKLWRSARNRTPGLVKELEEKNSFVD